MHVRAGCTLILLYYMSIRDIETSCGKEHTNVENNLEKDMKSHACAIQIYMAKIHKGKYKQETTLFYNI